MKFSEFKLSPEMEIEADRMCAEYERDMELAADEAWYDAHPMTARDIVLSAVEMLGEDIDDQFGFMAKRMKAAGASDEVLEILHRYRNGVERLVDECSAQCEYAWEAN